MNAQSMEKLTAVRLERAGRFEKASKQLIKLAWAIELVAVIIGLSIAFSRVADANQAGSVRVSIWSGVQLMGGFIIVSMGELTKIPLSLLLVNVRPLFKPVVFLVVAFVSAITFETVFLSLERGYNYQKSDIHAYRDRIKSLERDLDTDALRREIDSIEAQRQDEIDKLGSLSKYYEVEIQSIKDDYSKKGDLVKPAGFENADRELQEVTAALEKLQAEYDKKIKKIDDDEANSKLRLANDAQPPDEKLKYNVDSSDLPPEVQILNKQIGDLNAQQEKIKQDLVNEIDRIQRDYEKRKDAFLVSIDHATATGNMAEAKRYEGEIKKLAPANEKEKAREFANNQISEIGLRLNPLMDQRDKIILELASSASKNSEKDKLYVEQKAKQLSTKIDKLETEAELRRSEADEEFQAKRKDLETSLREAEIKLKDLNFEWQIKREEATKASDAEMQAKLAEAEHIFNGKSDDARTRIRNLKTSEEDRSKMIQTVNENAPSIQENISEARKLLCASMLNNQIFRISTRFNTAPLFGVEQNEAEVKLVGGPDPDCPAQPYVDEANADRVAFIWFGSIALLAATAGAATAITSQAFLRMAETLRWQLPTELGPARRPLLRTLRLAIVNWRWKRVRTVEVERIKEVPVDVVRNVEIVREVEHVVRELVPVPVFVPTGGNVENEIAKVRAHYEELNRLSRDAIMPPEPTFVTQEKLDDEGKQSVHGSPEDAVPFTDVDKVDEISTVASLDKPTDVNVAISDENEDKKV